MNGDGKSEIIFASAFDDQIEKTQLYLVDRKGRIAPGWPVELGRQDYGVYVSVIATANLDSTKDLEIVTASHPSVYNAAHQVAAFNIYGDKIWNFEFGAQDLVIADVDGDGMNEVIVLGIPQVENENWVIKVLVVEGATGRIERSRTEIIGPYINEFTFDQNRQEYIAFRSEVRVGQAGRLVKDHLFLADFNRNGLPEILTHYRYSYWKSFIPLEGPERYETLEDWTKILVLNDRLSPVGPGTVLRYSEPNSVFDVEPIIIDRLVDVTGNGISEVITSQVKSRFEVEVNVLDRHFNHVAQLSLESQTQGNGFVRFTNHMKTSFYDLTGKGFYDLFIPIPGGELHRMDARRSSPRRSQDWSVYRQNNQRTGYWKP